MSPASGSLIVRTLVSNFTQKKFKLKKLEFLLSLPSSLLFSFFLSFFLSFPPLVFKRKKKN